MCTTTSEKEGGVQRRHHHRKSVPPRQVIRQAQPFKPPPPSVPQAIVASLGVACFVLGLIWPPLILLVTYLLSQIIPYSFRKSDDASWRRRKFNEFRQNPDTPESFRNIPDDIVYEEKYWVNPRGMCLLTYTMTPKDRKIKAVVCFCHGYTDQASFMKRVEYQRFVREDVAIVAIEYEGHGRSDGALALIPDWKLLIDDTSTFFEEIVKQKFPDKKVFLMGESMGGAVCFSTYERKPKLFAGVVFVAPMCKIADEMLPPQWVIDFLVSIVGPSGTVSFLGYLPIAPSSGDLSELSYHSLEKRDIVNRSPTCFWRHPRLATARELLNTTSYISSNLKNFDAPFLVQHGKDDRVTDPKLSQALYEESKSSDKSIKLYDDMWHTITSGESDEDIDLVFRDSISWILERVN